MTTSPTGVAGLSLSLAVAAEIRAEMGRRSVTQRELAQRLHRDAVWLGRRIGRTASVDLTLEETAEIADALGVETEGIVVAALRACRDSNPKPSVSESRPGLRLVVGGLAGGVVPMSSQSRQPARLAPQPVARLRPLRVVSSGVA